MSESAQLIVAVLLFGGFAAVFLLGRSKPHKEHVATGTVMPNRPGSRDLVFLCELCNELSPVSSNRKLLRRYARNHAKQAHPGILTRR